VEPGVADPTAGRHALDEDAAMTPIFTALRRGTWRRPPNRYDDHRDPVERFRQDPPTAPIPLLVPVPAAGDRAVLSGGEPVHTGGYRYSGRGYGAPGDEDLYADYDEYDEADGHIDATWAADPYTPASFGPRPADRIPTGTADFLLRDPGPAHLPERRRSGAFGHELVSDTGRHHRRLAPAGW
jgi:hypothetical protein